MILHLRAVPGFVIAVEERDQPILRTRPVIVGGLPRQRGVVRETNVLAGRSGVRVGMTLSQAHQHCPEGVFLLPDRPHYDEVWGQIGDITRTFSPLVELLDRGQVVMDLTGCAWSGESEYDLARRVSGEIRGYTGLALSGGLASNRFVAQIASLAPHANGVIAIEPGQEREFLADLPVTLLPGVDACLTLSFQVLGLRMIGHLAALPASAVEQRFGVDGKRLHQLARGHDTRPVLPPPSRTVISARYDCEDGSIEEAIDGLRRLAERCALELQERRLAGKLIELKLIWEGEDKPALPRRPENDPPALPTTAPPRVDSTEQLPVPYRIHSMLPQPGGQRQAVTGSLQGSAAFHHREDYVPPVSSCPTLMGPCPQLERSPAGSLAGAKVVVRTAIDTAAPLLEQGQRLLIQHWPRPTGEDTDRPRLRALELQVGEFGSPTQLSFPELLRLDQTGRLGGLRLDRIQKVAEQEQMLVARYGHQPFRHVTRVDPGSILTERRFHWQPGLPWDVAASKTTPRKKVGQGR